ncbi:MAG: (Fe-S)-binding protein [Desulfobacterota bacterium]|nr:(Fe-S)-binding protein [Thermodesulfobacteriota bacterium]MDW8002248.1 (Fe-S)-binding protein [Deltaproteobacteria bacterium]
MNEKKELKKVEQYIEQCMKCGFCTYFCPVYQEEKVETSVARGKNYLIKLALQGQQEFTEEMGKIVGKCLLCKRCVVNCPAKAQIDRVVVGARAQMVNEKGLGFIKNLAFRKIMSDRKRFTRYLKLAKAFQWLLPKTEGNIRHLPDFLKALGAGRNIPELAKTFLRDMVKPVYEPQSKDKPVMKVGFFMGCATDFIYPEIGLKLIDFLTKRNVEVVVPKDQNCCGAPIYFSGDFLTGRLIADMNVEAFKEVDTIVTACATCSSTLKEYEKYLAETEEQKQKYANFGKKIKDSLEFIVKTLKVDPKNLKVRKEFHGKTVTWHDPCHLVRYQDIKDEPRSILKNLDGIKYVEMPNADLCCGMGGSFSIYHYDLTKRIAKKKLDGIKATGADIVVTACPGCMINLIDNVLQNRMPQRVYHIVELFE